MNDKHGAMTRLVHAGSHAREQHGFVNPPVYHGSTVLFESTEHLFGRKARYTYGRRGTPTTDALCQALRAIDGGAGVLLCPSGLSAIAVALTATLASGDHLLMVDTAYQPTRHFCDGELVRRGVETTYYDPMIGGGIAALLRENTRAVFVESPGSLTFEVQDIPAIAAAAHARGIAVIMDNTWATPLLFDAFGKGVDIMVQAGTKYICGHSDVMLGVISANAQWFPRVSDCWNSNGLSIGPDDVYLALRGLRTMGVRLERHQASALQIAQWLQGRPEVARVLHPALPGHPGHAVWKRDFTGASGLFAFELHPVARPALCAFLDGLELFGLGYSWGGVESLAVPFDPRPIRTATRWESPGQGVRLSIGLEAVADLKADLAAGLDRLAATT
jgi:cystathionine beta-lyase